MDVALTALRPRVTSNAYLSLGAETEWQDYRTEPRSLLAKLDSGYTSVFAYPALVASAGWSNARSPALAISPEDGVQLALSAKQRWLADDPVSTRSTSVIGVAAAFKSLDLPGFAHHVLALRVAGGWEDEKATSELDAGGISGTMLSIAPGVTLGDPQRTFFARGFPAGVQQGTRALGANLEYRAPVAVAVGGIEDAAGLPAARQRGRVCRRGERVVSVRARGIRSLSDGDAAGLDGERRRGTASRHCVAVRCAVQVPLRHRDAAWPGKQYFGEREPVVVLYFAMGLAF